MSGNKDEALEAAERVLKNDFKNVKTDYLKESPLIVFSHAILARVQLKERDAGTLFELAAKKFQQIGKMKEASISYAEQGFGFQFLGKFKESDQSLKLAKSLLERIDKKNLPSLQKTIIDYEVHGKNMLVLVESDDSLKRKMALHSKEIATPISLQYEILVFFGDYFMSTGKFKEANFYFSNALNLVNEGYTIPKDAKKALQENLEKINIRLQER